MKSLIDYRLFGIATVSVILLGCSKLPVNAVYRSEGDKQVLRGLIVAAGTLDVVALRQRLPAAIVSQGQVIVVIDDCDSCGAAVGLPFEENDTGVPAVLVSDLAMPDKPFAKSVSHFTRKEMDCIPTELYNVAPVGLLINLNSKQVTPAKGPFVTWSSCYGQLRRNVGYSAQE